MPLGLPISSYNLYNFHLSFEIPVTELVYLRDQVAKVGSKGKLQILGNDAVESKKIERSMKRKADEEAAAAAKKAKEEKEEEELRERLNSFNAEAAEEDANEGSEVEDADSSFHHEQTDRKLKPSAQNLLKLDNAAMQTIRTGTSPSAAALIITGAFVDAGIVSKEDPSKICLPGKLQRACKRIRDEYEVRENRERLKHGGYTRMSESHNLSDRSIVILLKYFLALAWVLHFEGLFEAI